MPLDALRLARTLRPLRGVQFCARARNLLCRPRFRPVGVPSLRSPTGNWTQPVAHAAALTGPASFRFLNREGSVNTPAQWNDPAHDKLWLYNLHYFDDLNAANADVRALWHRVLIDRWIAENPPTLGNGWEPYPASLRIVNWVKYFLAGNRPEAHWQASLAAQAQWLSQRLEFHLLGNHLLANAKALIYAGLYFQGGQAERWLARGLSIYREQLKEQILGDGGHFERSPMYHALILEDLLDLINIVQLYCPQLEDLADWSDTARNMQHWLACMCHPDGDIAFFNDAAFGIAADLESLNAFVMRLRLPQAQPRPSRLVQLPDSGYLRAAMSEAVVLIDAAPVGPGYIPGHAHADTLSFEMSLGEERIIVNGGTSTYSHGAQRQFERSTAAHSTVQINGQNSSEVWASFRVGRKARVRDVLAATSEEAIQVSAAHDGYRWLTGRPQHRRTWVLKKGHLTVHDGVGGGYMPAVARFHLGPDVQVHVAPDGRQGTFATPLGRLLRWRTSAPATIAASQWHPEFGKTVATQVLQARLDAGRLTFELSW